MSNNGITLGQVVEQLNNKVDMPSGVSQSDMDYVIESKFPTSSDPTWYRVYKSGWCEQGGLYDNGSNGQISDVQITLLKEMSNTKYNIQITSLVDGSSANFKTSHGVRNIKKDSFNTGTYNDNARWISWEVKGMGA